MRLGPTPPLRKTDYKTSYGPTVTRALRGLGGGEDFSEFKSSNKSKRSERPVRRDNHNNKNDCHQGRFFKPFHLVTLRRCPDALADCTRMSPMN